MSKYKVVVMQENYEYYECDENGNPTGDMIDHNYDAPYRYVVREDGEFEDIDDFDTYEGAVDYANELNKEQTMSETRTGWWSVKFDLTLDGENVRWEDLDIDTQAHILEQINEGYYQGEIIEE